MTRSKEPSTRLVLGSLAAAFAFGTILYLTLTKPERASALSAALLMFLLGAVFLALGALGRRVTQTEDQEMSAWSADRFQSMAEFYPVVATGLLAVAISLVLSLPFLP